jgi:biopolymer transport protein ExbD
MSRHKTPGVKEDVTANLIPMIDIMFLLLLFFMLGADMSRREIAEVDLARADTVVEEEKLKDEDDAFSSTFNVAHKGASPTFHCAVNASHKVCRDMSHWLIVIRAQEYDLATVKDQIDVLAEDSRETEIDPVARRKMSKAKISIRADKFAPYGHVQQLITLCGLAGIYKIEIVAARPAAERT